MNEDVKSTGVHIHSRADELISCLEGEIAKRDEELAACRVAVENCEVFRARIAELEQDLAYFPSTVRSLAETVTKREVEINQLRGELGELAAIRAQEPVAWVAGFYRDVIEGKTSCAPLGAEVSFVNMGWLGQIPLYAAPVSEAKAQGVVIPEQLMTAITRADDVLHAISNWESSSVKLEQRHGQEWTKEVDAIRRELHTQLARLNAAPVQHPDDDAVDRFAIAMKAKLAASREKGRHGWQNATAPHLSSLLHEHMYKADPLDVGNLAMMLHQNGQAIELPHDARRVTTPVQQVSVPDGWKWVPVAPTHEMLGAALMNQVECLDAVEVIRMDYRARLAAAPAAPAADAGHVIYGMDGNHP